METSAFFRFRGPPRIRLSASAAFDDHVLVVLQHDFVEIVDVQHADGGEFGRHAASPRHGGRVHRVDERLHDGVIGRVQVVGQREGTIAVAVIGVVSGRSHDPVVPTDVGKVHVKRVSPAVPPVVVVVIVSVFPLVFARSSPLSMIRVAPLPFPSSAAAIRRASVVAVRHQQRRRAMPRLFILV